MRYHEIPVLKCFKGYFASLAGTLPNRIQTQNPSLKAGVHGRSIRGGQVQKQGQAEQRLRSGMRLAADQRGGPLKTNACGELS